MSTQNRRRFLRSAGLAAGGLAVGGLGATPAAANDVTLGENETFTQMNRESSGDNRNGIVLRRGFSNANADRNLMEADVDALTGVGDARFWAETGRRFSVSGDGSQQANISFRGSYTARLRALAGAGAEIAITCRLNDLTEGDAVRSGITRVGGQEIGRRTINIDYSGSLNESLTGGHNYVAWVRATARIDTLTENITVLPRADMATQDREATVRDIRVRF